MQIDSISLISNLSKVTIDSSEGDKRFVKGSYEALKEEIEALEAELVELVSTSEKG